MAYYSYEGNTRLLSERIAEEIGADLLEIKPKKEMRTKNFMKFVWGGSQVVMGKEPELLPLERDPSEYDLIFVGTPVWSWRPAPPVRTFLKKYFPRGKKTAFFCSCEGGPGKTLIKMEEMAKDPDVVGTMEFFAPLKKDRDVTLKKAAEWAASVISSPGSDLQQPCHVHNR